MPTTAGAISRGGIAKRGGSHKTYERPGTKFVAGFIGEANIIRANVAELRTGNGLMKHDRLEIVAPAEGLSVGEELFLFVRPEKFRWGSAADGRSDRFGVTIVYVF